ncbi:hypothetical protein HOO65_100043 [Ceratocystis lukuohia]|uniref:CCHC-type domain-containing protein n=1 Tax=Ceratocystis lukuohia TaxID=2019550 RepID=A0ABR4M8N5_9PEZI
MKGRRARKDVRANSMKLTELEEKTLLEYILGLGSRGFPPRLVDVEAMANVLLAERNSGRVGKLWASNFVKRQPKLWTRFNRAHDHQRAPCKDPDQTNAQPTLAQSMALQTPTAASPPQPTDDPCVSQTPHDPTEAGSQSTFVEGRIAHNHSSSQTPIYSAVDEITKGAEEIMREVVLLRSENKMLREANHALSQRRRAKKAHFRKGGSLATKDGHKSVDQKNLDEQLEQGRRKNGSRKHGTAAAVRRHCGNCGKTGHNARTCEDDSIIAEGSSSE